MANEQESITQTWQTVLDELATDERITPPLHGFLNLVVPKGIMAGTFYLEVPNEFTAGQLNMRMRAPLLKAIGTLQESRGRCEPGDHRRGIRASSPGADEPAATQLRQ
jgi:chromosomal replication initiator protein